MDPQVPTVRLTLQEQVNQHLYLLLLGILLLVILSASLLSGSVAGLIMIDALLFLAFVLVALAFMRDDTTSFLSYVALALLATGLDAARMIAFRDSFIVLTNVCGALFALLVMAAIWLMAKRIARERVVNIDMMMGSVCVYVLVGLLWFVFYQMTFTSDPAAFKYEGPINTFQLVYFSFNTLTTLGNGDIVPVHPLPQALCNMEAIAGQMFPAIFISRLVSLYVVHELDQRRAASDQEKLSVN